MVAAVVAEAVLDWLLSCSVILANVTGDGSVVVVVSTVVVVVLVVVVVVVLGAVEDSCVVAVDDWVVDVETCVLGSTVDNGTVLACCRRVDVASVLVAVVVLVGTG